jgi:hypothetical protein
VVRQAVTQPRIARIEVRTADADLSAFQRSHDVDVDVTALNLQGLFPILVGDGRQ